MTLISKTKLKTPWPIKLNSMTNKKPQLEDFYDPTDPRGCSSSEFNDYMRALEMWEKEQKKQEYYSFVSKNLPSSSRFEQKPNEFSVL